MDGFGLDQLEFLRSVLGTRGGFLETVDLSAPPGTSPTWVPYPLAQPLTQSNLGFRPVVVPTPAYDVAENGLACQVVAATIDKESPLSLPPSIITEESTSGLQHVYWQLSREESYSELEDFRRRLDPLGQSASYLPLPGTDTTRSVVQPTSITIEAHPSLRAWSPDEVRRIEPVVLAPQLSYLDLLWEPDPAQLGSGVAFFLTQRLTDQEAARRIGLHLSRPKYAFDKLISEMFDQGLTLPEMVWVGLQAQCNPALAFTFGQAWETARRIARVISTFTQGGGSLEAIARTIQQVRRRNGRALDKLQDVSRIVRDDMSRRGVLLHAVDSTYWYVNYESGEAIELGPRNERLHILLNRRYGISSTASEHGTIIADAIADAGSLPKVSQNVALSFYRDSDRHLWVHFGGREVVVLTPDGIRTEGNGQSGLIFNASPESDPVVTSSLRTNLPLDWWDEFLPPSYFRSLVGIDPRVASALMRVWAQFVLFREEARTRPLLAFLGPIGSGKSTFARRLYTLLYGGRKDLTAIDGPKEYDTITSNNPFVVFDNLDRCPPWLPSRLELSITPREQDRRKLFTDNTIYHIRCGAIVGITAHDPSIFREGILDRMMVLHFRRLNHSERLPESLLAQQVLDRREEFLSGLLSDAQRILQTPRAPFLASDWDSTIRILDFMDMGAWFATALGCLTEFKEAVSSLVHRQTSLMLEGESSLVDSLETFAKKKPDVAREWMTGSALWNHLADHSPDPGTFTLLYKTPAVLGSKIAGIYVHLKDSVGLESQEDPRTARKLWRVVAPTTSQSSTGEHAANTAPGFIKE